MRSVPKFVLVAMLLGVFHTASAQSASTYGLGRTPTAEEIRAWDIIIGPDGKELPQGRGTAKEGAQLYVEKGCAACHGATGTGGPAPNLIKSSVPANATPDKTPQPPEKVPCIAITGLPGMCSRGVAQGIDYTVMVLHSPYATVIWEFINRGMPLSKEQSLKPNEVYALTAYLLYKNDIIKEDDVMDAQSLPKVKMPNHDGFITPHEWKHGTPRQFTILPEPGK